MEDVKISLFDGRIAPTYPHDIKININDKIYIITLADQLDSELIKNIIDEKTKDYNINIEDKTIKLQVHHYINKERKTRDFTLVIDKKIKIMGEWIMTDLSID